MTLKVDIIILDENGVIVDKTYIAIANYLDFNNLQTLRDKFEEMYRRPMMLWRNAEDHIYAYPEHIPTWMWSIEDGTLLPNKFFKGY